MIRYLSWALFLVAMCLAGAGLYSFLCPAPDLPAFAVPIAERDLGDRPVGKSILTYDITNQSDMPRRILGLAEG